MAMPGVDKPLLVKVVHAYSPLNNDELKLEKGDVITVTQKEEGGWWEGTLNGRTGWFPSNYAEEQITIDGENSVMNPGNPSPITKGATKPLQLPNAYLPTEEQLRYRQTMLLELADSEESFIRELEDLSDNYIQKLPVGRLTSSELSVLTASLQEMIYIHKTLVLNPLRTEQVKHFKEQRIGKLFLDVAPRLEESQKAYSETHPKVIQIIEGNIEAVTEFMDSKSQTVLKLITSLSLPFRRFEKYPMLLQQVGLHFEESHKDRGDLQRSIEYYKNIDILCGSLRKQKEMELEVLNGSIKSWEGSDISQLGKILHMNLVHIGQNQQPRYFVLFPNTLLILLYNSEDNTLTYDGKIPVSGITLPQPSDGRRLSSDVFEISGPMIESILVKCGSRTMKETWIGKLNKVLKTNRFPSIGSSPPQQSFGQLSPPIQAWSISRLRPNPPTNPMLMLESHQPPFTQTNGLKSTPTKGSTSRHEHDTGSTSTPVKLISSNVGNQIQSLLTNEEDLTILSIVDAFCSANRQNSGGSNRVCGGMKTKPKTLAEMVFAISDEVTRLSLSLEKVVWSLSEEQRERKALEVLIHNHILWTPTITNGSSSSPSSTTANSTTLKNDNRLD